MTLDEARRLLRSFLADFNGLTHSDADLNDWLVQGANEVAALTLGYQKSMIFTDMDTPQALEEGCHEYRLAGDIGDLGLGILDCLKVLYLHLDGVALPRITPDQYSQVDPEQPASGRPHYWYEYAGYVGLVPAPAADFLTTYSLEVTYAASVGEWTAGTSGLPSSFEPMILPYAALKALVREGRWQEAGLTFMAWFRQVQAQPLIVHQPRTVKRVLTLAPTTSQRLRRRA